MTIARMKERKKELGYTNARIAELSGLPIGTVQKIFSGETASPRYGTVQKLEKVLGLQADTAMAAEAAGGGMKPQAIKGAGRYNAPQEGVFSGMVREAAEPLPFVKKTIRDFYAMPEDWKGELIDGVIYSMSSPRILHQRTATLIGIQLEAFIRENKGTCLMLSSPLDTQLDMDDYTMLEPDIMVICDRDKIKNGIIYGAPDLVMEILSPSTKAKDIFVKVPKYMRAGVRECWIVDPKEQVVQVWIPDAKILPVQYSFSDRVPVHIWEDRCLVDFPEIAEETAFLRDEA